MSRLLSWIVVLNVTLSMGAPTAQASMTKAQYVQYRNNKDAGVQEIVTIYFKAVAATMIAMNAAAKNRIGSSLFCIPMAMPLGSDVLMQLVDQKIAAIKIEDDTQVSLLAVIAMMETAPCTQQGN